MNKFTHSLYGKISAVFLVLLLVLGVVQILISVNSSLNFVRESEQQLNRNLGQDLANEFKPFLKDSLDTEGIEHTIHHLMVMNPRVEIYLLDENGKILAFFADPKKRVKLDFVGLEPLRAFLDNTRTMPILGDDPRHLGRKKPFSAAPLQISKAVNGFIYVILGWEQYDSTIAMIKESYIIRTTAINLGLIFIATGIIGLILFALLTKRFHKMTAVVQRFKKGDFEERINIKSGDEIGQLAKAFNQMADTIVANMDELKQTDRLRRELIGNVSLDLRSPLASMRGYLETILMKDASLSQRDRKKYLQIIHDNSIMLTKLVDELFELSKLDAKQVQPKREIFSIAELTQDVVMKFQPEAEMLKVHLQASLPKNLPMINADIGMIERALSNFIDNALQYTPVEGTVKIDLSQKNDKVCVVVSDTGVGIPKEQIPLVFERFYRVEKSRSRSSGGTGLGLAIAKRILDLHESTISVQSIEQEGTAFSFDL